MTRGGRSRRASSRPAPRGGDAPPAGPSARPAAQPTPLGVSNSVRPAAALASLKSTAAAPAPAARAAAVPPPLLPGLEDEEGMPIEPRGRLPVAQESFEGFGDALGCLRVTSLTRSATARRRSLLRLVQQPDEAEGRHAHSLPPTARPPLRARTQPLLDGDAAPGPQSRRRGSGHGEPARQECCAEAPGPPLPEEKVAEHGRTVQQPPTARATFSTSTCSDAAPAAAPAAIAAGHSGASSEPVPPTLLPPPLPVLPGAAGMAAGEQLQQAAGSEPAAAEQPSRPAEGAVLSGLLAAEEVAALAREAPTPNRLAPQGRTNATVQGAHVELEPYPALSVQAQQAAALWRAQWTSGLQWHNAMHAGGPLRAGSKLPFVPLDPNEPVLEVLMFRAAVMPADVVAGAARFQDLVFGEPELHSQALDEGVLRFGLWAMPAGGGTYTLVAGGSLLALPLSFHRASPQLLALFLACVWTEANNQETDQALAYSFGAGGERTLDESALKYPATELEEWVHLAAGGQRAAASSAALASLRSVAVFGTQ